MIPALGIKNANTGTVLDASALPSVAATIKGWFRPLTLIRKITQLVDREAVISEVPLRCMGVIQPLTNRELVMKPEGQRAWRWNMLHTSSDVQLNPGEDFSVNGKNYRVMSDKGYSEYGYIYYEVVQDYGR